MFFNKFWIRAVIVPSRTITFTFKVSDIFIKLQNVEVKEVCTTDQPKIDLKTLYLIMYNFINNTNKS